MARDEAPPFARGETWYGVGSSGTVPVSATDYNLGALGIGGINIEGKEYVFEPNSPDIYQGGYSNTSQDPNGRPIRVKVVRNTSGVNLLPGRLVKFDESDVSDVDYSPGAAASTRKLETGVYGYCTQVSDHPAGIVDEFLPAGGVVANDLFYIVTEGPTLFTNVTGTPSAVAPGSVLVPANTSNGTTLTDSNGGRVDLQANYINATNVTNTTTGLVTLCSAIQNRVGKSEVTLASNTTNASALFAGVIHRAYR